MNNIHYNNNSFIGTIHQDSFKIAANLIELHSSNYTNTISNIVDLKSSNYTNSISNILDNKSSNYTINTSNNILTRYDPLIKEELENIILPIPATLKHTYINNSNSLGEIRFWVKDTKDFPIPVPFGVPDYRVKIDIDGKLKVYYTYDPFISITIGNSWLDVSTSLISLVASDINIGITIAGLEAQIQNNFATVQEQFAALFCNLYEDDVINGAMRTRLEVDQAAILASSTVTTTTGTLEQLYIYMAAFYRTQRLSRLSQAVNLINLRISQNAAAAFFLGIGGIALSYIYGISQAQSHNDYISTVLNGAISSNLNFTTEQKRVLYDSNTISMMSNYIDQLEYTSNMTLSQGFINKYDITSQLIPSLNTSNINLNYGNITGVGTINATTGIFYNLTTTNNTNIGLPTKGNFGGIGDKIILSTGSSTTYPSSIGMDTNDMWLSTNSNLRFYNNGNNTVSITSNFISNNHDLTCYGQIKENNEYLSNIYTTSNLLYNINYTTEREYPSKLYTSFSSQSVITYLTQNPTYYETITLNTTDITYGSGTYEIYSSSIDNTTVNFTGTGSSLNTVSGNTDYAYVMFPNSGTFTINNNLICDILIVGGGGGGGGFGGGGGAGAILFATNYTIPSGTHTITVGTGGAGAPRNTNGTNGNSSSITISGTSYIAIGGGGGGSRIESGNPFYGRPGNNGGSGGGGGHSDGVTTPQNNLGGTSTKNIYSDWTSYGNSGGYGKNADYGATGYGSGGGGGAGSVGTNAGNNSGGNGGTGINMNSYFGSVVGNNGWFGGGGGGGSYSGRSGYINGYGNGGNGNYGGGGNAFSVNGLANTGGGGGGADYNNISGNGGTGGSGVVIIRFLNSIITIKKELFNKINIDTNPFKTFQYNATTGNYLTTNRYINNYYGDWLIIKIPNPIYITKYRIYNKPSFIENAPSLFKIFASTDGIIYDEISEASNNTTALTTSNYSTGYYEKTFINQMNKSYSYFGLVVNKIIAGTANSHFLNFSEFKLYGKEISNYIPIYASSNVVKSLIIYDTPQVNKKNAFYCVVNNVIYPDGGDVAYYCYHINLNNYTKTGYLDYTNDPYRVFKITCFYAPCYFQMRNSSGLPDICEYTIYMSNKQNSGGSGTKTGLNICAIGTPISYSLDTIPPQKLFILRNASENFNYISIVSKLSGDVRVIIECLLS